MPRKVASHCLNHPLLCLCPSRKYLRSGLTTLSYLLQLVLSMRILATPCGPAGEGDDVAFVDTDAGDANDGEVESRVCG